MNMQMTNITHSNIDGYHLHQFVQVLYFMLDVTFLEFIYIPASYQIIKDVGVLLIFSIYYLNIINKIILGCQISCAWEEFCHIESLWEKCLWYVSSMNAFVIFILFSLPFRLGRNAVLILIIFTLHTSLLPHILAIVLYYPLLMPLKNHV